MTYKKIIPLFAFLIILSSLIYADCTYLNDGSIKGYFKFESDCITDDSGLGNDGTASGSPASGATGKIGNACDFEKNDGDYITINDVKTDLDYTKSRSYCGWVKTESPTTQEYQSLVGARTDDSNWEVVMIHDSGAGHDGWDAEINKAASSNQAFDNTVTDTNFHYVCGVFDSAGHSYLYRDGVLEAADITNTITVTGYTNLYIAYWGVTGTFQFDGILDEVMIIEKNISLSDHQALYNSGDGCDPTVATTASLTLTSNLVNGSKVGFVKEPDGVFEIEFNGSVLLTSDFFNCTLYDAGVSIDTLSNVNITQNQVFNYDFNAEAQQHIFNVSCSNSNASDSTGIFYYYMDGINPETSFTLANYTQFFRNITASNVSFNYTCSDNNLYHINVSCYYPNGTILYSYFVQDINFTTWSNATSFNLNAAPLGIYNCVKSCSDDHTKQDNIKPMAWHEVPGAVIIDNEIRLEGDLKTGLNNKGLPYTTFTLSPDGSKYKFKLTFNEEAYSHTFRMKTSENLYYRPQSSYMGLFVYYPLKRWIDLVNPNIYDIRVSQLSGNEYEITVYLLEAADEIEFESIGDLNYIEEQSFFYINESFYVYAYDINLLSPLSSFTVTLYNTTFEEIKSTTSGAVAFNITLGNYSINITHVDYQSAAVSNVSLSPAGNYSFYLIPKNAVYLYFYDEITGELIDDRFVNVTLVSDDFAANYTTAIGISITTALPGSYDVIYLAENYTRRFSYFVLSNDTANNSLYLLETAVDDDVILTVLDPVSNPVEDAYIYIYRYYVNTNDYINVVTRRTDFQGIAKINLQLDSEYYKFEIYYNGALKYATEKAYITETAYDFTINQEGLTLDEFYSVINTIGSLSFNNATDMMTFTYLDSSGSVDQGCLEINLVSAAAETLYNKTCLSSAGGSISIYLINTTGRKYTAAATLTVDSQEYLFDTLTMQYDTRTDFGSVGLFVVAFLLIIMITIALKWPTTGLFLMGFPFIIGSAFNFINLRLEYSLGIEFACILMAALIRRRGQ